MASKSWYVVKASYGCMGATGKTERIAEGLTKREAEKITNEHKREARGNNHAVFWIDFDWK